jgi:outer membrane protein
MLVSGVWYLVIDTTAEITTKANRAIATKVKFNVDIDPWVYNVGIAYKF